MVKKIGKALVVGAGISGIRSALDLAQTGYGVTLIDRAPHLGGILSQLDYQFPTNHCGMCKMLPLVHRDAASQFCLRKGLFHENIEIRLGTEVNAIEGEPGNFTVSMREKPKWVDPDRCIGCGLCVDVCPVEVADEFNAKLAKRKAIYLPVPHSIPNPYVLDISVCTHCGACSEVCPTDAIELAMDRRKDFHILVVDDELIVRDSLMAWLEDDGFTVDTAESGKEALEKLTGQSFHLMLTDIKMPGMDGVELLAAAKEILPGLNIVMMTAYATVETAVEAMKIGALDYLIKPFDPETLVPKIVNIYSNLEAGQSRQMTAGAVVLSGGTDTFNPADDANVYGYEVNPHVITNLELERILSGTGPSQGRLIRPHDGKPVKKVAWIQCVGSRDIQKEADFCSSICCMVAVKEAMLVKERIGNEAETTIFYTDMRTYGKAFQRYRQRAECDCGVHFERARIHSIATDRQSGDPVVRYVRNDGSCLTDTYEMVVLATGQRPAEGTAQLAEMADISLNPWGFVQTGAFSPVNTDRTGIVAGGSYSGLKDIGESVIFASAASVEASKAIHSAGGGLAAADARTADFRDVSKEEPKILVVICLCGNSSSTRIDAEELRCRLEEDPCIQQVAFLEQSCTAVGWEELVKIAAASSANRVLIGACHPYLFIRKLNNLAAKIHLNPELLDVVDVLSPVMFHSPSQPTPDDAEKIKHTIFSLQYSAIAMGISRLKNIEPLDTPMIPVSRKALVVGGGIAGMQASLYIADHGHPVELVERSERLGGNLHWLARTLEGETTEGLLEETVQKVEKHPLISIHQGSRISQSFGEVGRFYSTIENGDGTLKTLEHGVTIIATGGDEAATTAYGYGQSKAIVTQKELESRLSGEDFDFSRLDSIVMIQCVESREEPYNFCSRVCCPTSLKHALKLKEMAPDLSIYILYRDIMTHGFTESYYTEARKAGIIFIPYDVSQKPQVDLPGNSSQALQVHAFDPILGMPLDIEADLLVLATGVEPRLPVQLSQALGIAVDQDHFFSEAESKWRPVDALKAGIFACGLALSPRSIAESIASAGAAAQRSLKILASEKLPAGKIVATVRHSLCSLCERCIESCPYNARVLDANQEKVLVNPAMCQGCGECATVCPNSASTVFGFKEKQMFDLIDSAVEQQIVNP